MDGNWLLDPLDQTLRSASQADGQEPSSAQRKLREIPIRIHVNDPSLVVRSRLEAFDVVTRRTVCASKGDGQAKRWTGTQGTVDVACEGCDNCSFALSGQVSCGPDSGSKERTRHVRHEDVELQHAQII